MLDWDANWDEDGWEGDSTGTFVGDSKEKEKDNMGDKDGTKGHAKAQGDVEDF
jgi:hypothetical protein